MTRAELQSADGLRRIWFDVGATQQYYPVTHTAFWVLGRIAGRDTFGYHLLNIALHSLSAWLVGMILRRLAMPGAWLAAVIFALHPVHVESVAWITELKNTLSGAFYLAAAWWYLRFDEERETRSYVAAIVLFALALLSKTVTATLPAALLVVFWWRRGRLDWRRDVRPLVPFLLLGVAAAVLTAWVERAFIGAVGEHYRLTPIERILVAGRAIWFYLATLVWPIDLMFNYPRWPVSPQVWWHYLFPAGFRSALVAGLWWWRARSRGPLAAVLFFAGTLVPALGFFDVYPFRFSFVADHFQYLASLGIIALAAAGVMTGCSCVDPAGMTVRAAHRERRDGDSARGTDLHSEPAVCRCRDALPGHDRAQSFELAGAHQPRRAAARPDSGRSRPPARGVPADPSGPRRGAQQPRHRLPADEPSPGEDATPLREHTEAVRLQPDLTEAHYNLGIDTQGLARFDEAVTHYRRALQLKPGYVAAHNNLGSTLAQLARFDERRTRYREALRLEPGSTLVQENLARVCNAQGVSARRGDGNGRRRMRRRCS